MFSCTFISCSLINNSSLTVNVRHFLDQQITSTCEKQKLPLPCVHQMFFSSSGFLRYRLLFSFVSLYLTHIVCGSIIGLLTQHGNTWQQKYVLSMLMSVKNSWFLCRIIFGPVSAWKRTGVRANVFSTQQLSDDDAQFLAIDTTAWSQLAPFFLSSTIQLSISQFKFSSISSKASNRIQSVLAVLLALMSMFYEAASFESFDGGFSLIQ